MNQAVRHGPRTRYRSNQRTKNKPRNQRDNAKVEVSAGGIVYMRRRGRAKVILVGRFEPFVTWRLPKGHPERGESLIEAAKREVREEAGVSGRGGPKLGTTNYFFTHPVTKKFIHKFVHYFLFKKESGSVSQHDKEYDDARWFTLEQAIKRASFKDDKTILRRAAQIIKKRQQKRPN
jgi:8-oxo-dGTP pyrophosphatase MutT (NUDIX family)